MIDRIHQWSHLALDFIFDYCFSLFVCVCLLSRFSLVHLFATLWTVAHQVSLSMGFSRQEHWNGLPCPPPGNLPHPGIKPRSPALQVDSLPAELPGKPFIQYMSFYSLLISQNMETYPYWCKQLHLLYLIYNILHMSISMGSQRVRHDWVTELNWTDTIRYLFILLFMDLEEGFQVFCCFFFYYEQWR